jgi:hypothetical protein
MEEMLVIEPANLYMNSNTCRYGFWICILSVEFLSRSNQVMYWSMVSCRSDNDALQYC